VKVPTPCITGVGEFSLSIDNVPQLLRAPIKSFRRALEAWLASYWIFSIEILNEVEEYILFFGKGHTREWW